MRLSIFFTILLIKISAIAGPHTLQKGEAFTDIARLYAIPLDSLLRANPQTQAYTGLTIEVPIHTLVYDLGNSYLFRAFRYKYSANASKGLKAYNNGYKKQLKFYSYSLRKKESVKQEIIQSYEKAISYGNVDALYQLGRYKIHGYFYNYDGFPSFNQPINQNLDEFQQGIEYLQIAAIIGNNREALIELAVACGHEMSPIRNPYLCLSMLEHYQQELELPLNGLLCYMYENGYGINADYLQAYLHCESSILVKDREQTHREKILARIDSLSTSFETAKYGAGLDVQTMLSIGLSYYRHGILEPEGIFWLHRAARAGNADANWFLAGILQNSHFRKGTMGTLTDIEPQMLHFARKAAKLGKQEAIEYIASYEAYQKEIKKRKREQEARRQAKAEERKRRKQEMWANIAGTLLQTAAQTYVAVEASKHQNQVYSPAYSPQLSAGHMSDAQWLAKNQQALEQIMQYTINKSYADWTGTPMVPTDMSAVNLGNDMSPGSPLWSWCKQQEINRMQTVNTKMSCEIVAYYRRQADLITQQMIENPLQPIAGYVDYDGNWISSDMVASGNSDIHTNNTTENNSRYNAHEEIRAKNRDYYSERYGNRECHHCHGRRVCQTCNGNKYYHSDLGSAELECTNCWIKNGHRTGLCSVCQGKGYVYGLK